MSGNGSIDDTVILDAAASVFATKGFSGARVDEIASRAGVNKAMLYYRVGDKKELYRRVVLRGQAAFRGALEDALEASPDGRGALAEILRKISEKVFSDDLMPSIILRELADRGRTLPAEGLEGIRGFMATVRSVVERGIGDGSFRPVDPVALQFCVIGALFTLALSRDLRRELQPAAPGPLTAGDASAALLDLLADGLFEYTKGDRP